MSRLSDLLRTLAAELLTVAGPGVVFGVAGAVLGGLVALGLALLVARVVARIRRRPVRVASLAARGASRAEIARRTGISQDAVGMLLHVRGVHRGRRNLPVAARIAVSQHSESRRKNRDWNPQNVTEKADREAPAGWSRSARPLPSPGASANRPTRSGRMA